MRQAHHAGKDASAIGLVAQLDRITQAGVGQHDRSRCMQRSDVDLRADEAPAVLAMTEQRVDAVGAHAALQQRP